VILPKSARDKGLEATLAKEWLTSNVTNMQLNITDLWLNYNAEETAKLTEFVRHDHPKYYTLHLRTILGTWTTRSQSKHWEAHDGTCNLCDPYNFDDETVFVQQTFAHLTQCPFVVSRAYNIFSQQQILFLEQELSLNFMFFFWGVITATVPTKHVNKFHHLYLLALEERSDLWSTYINPKVTV